MNLLKIAATAAAASTIAFAGATSAGTLQDVVKKGFVQCGVSTGVPGFNSLIKTATGRVLTQQSARQLLLLFWVIPAK